MDYSPQSEHRRILTITNVIRIHKRNVYDCKPHVPVNLG